MYKRIPTSGFKKTLISLKARVAGQYSTSPHLVSQQAPVSRIHLARQYMQVVVNEAWIVGLTAGGFRATVHDRSHWCQSAWK